MMVNSTERMIMGSEDTVEMVKLAIQPVMLAAQEATFDTMLVSMPDTRSIKSAGKRYA